MQVPIIDPPKYNDIIRLVPASDHDRDFIASYSSIQIQELRLPDTLSAATNFTCVAKIHFTRSILREQTTVFEVWVFVRGIDLTGDMQILAVTRNPDSIGTPETVRNEVLICGFQYLIEFSQPCPEFLIWKFQHVQFMTAATEAHGAAASLLRRAALEILSKNLERIE